MQLKRFLMFFGWSKYISTSQIRAQQLINHSPRVFAARNEMPQRHNCINGNVVGGLFCTICNAFLLSSFMEKDQHVQRHCAKTVERTLGVSNWFKHREYSSLHPHSLKRCRGRGGGGKRERKMGFRVYSTKGCASSFLNYFNSMLAQKFGAVASQKQ